MKPNDKIIAKLKESCHWLFGGIVVSKAHGREVVGFLKAALEQKDLDWGKKIKEDAEEEKRWANTSPTLSIKK